MILELTRENLQSFGLSEEHINDLYNTKSSYHLECNEGKFYASKPENKLYTENDFYRKIYLKDDNLRFPFHCPDLVPEYYELARLKFLENQHKELGALFNKIEQTKNFIEKQIEQNNTIQSSFLAKEIKMRLYLNVNPNKGIEICKAYNSFLAKKLTEHQSDSEEIEEINIEKYLKSYRHHFFSNVINKRVDGIENPLFYHNATVSVLNQQNDNLKNNKSLNETQNLLSTYNKYLFSLINDVTQLYKAINTYKDTNSISLITVINIKTDVVKNNLEEIKKFGKTITYNERIDDNIQIAIKIRDYYVFIFNDWIDVLKNKIGIDVYKSPLKKEFKELEKALNKKIELSKIKMLSDLNQRRQDATSKNYLINKKETFEIIKNAEEMAIQGIEYSFEMDLHSIKTKSINDDHYNQLFEAYTKGIIIQYGELANIYKASNDSFDYIRTKSKNQLTDSDRIELTVVAFAGLLSENNQTKKQKEIQNQFDDLFNIVYETKTLQLKDEMIRKAIDLTENEKNSKDNVSILESTLKTEDTYLGQPTNTKGNQFFEFLVENYRPSQKTTVKYVNILHFLKKDADKKSFIFNLKQEEYKLLIKTRIGIEIKKFAKSERYDEVEKPILFALENSFLKL
ncbi:hypothetical protein J2Y38_004705 [Flavobacterium sp. 2755]|uniref:hypothetical protein n=1 Tax=Flavobacterium sp. 2755 TaxID=2817765 RepID=UPI00286009D3|nr:hypothetical protein [Flavobacterium sp. 2755]MDR6764472.1 hypothetical protein [Flavobacterium sp. 2755]